MKNNRIDTEISLNDKYKITEVLLTDGDNSLRIYITANKVIIPSEVIDHYRNNSVTDDIIKKWFTDSKPWPGFGAEDEIRSEIIKIYGESRLHTIFNFKAIERLTGEELYSKYPVYGYYQQGDTIHCPDESFNVQITDINSFLDRYLVALSDDIKKEFLEYYAENQKRIKQNIFYELLEGTFLNEKYVCLKMGNASLYSKADEIHIEPVPPNIRTIYDSILFRNSANAGRNIVGLPFMLS